MMSPRPSSTSGSFYRGVPVVNLLTIESQRSSLRLFGAEGRLLAVRLALVLLVIAGGVAYVLAGQATAHYKDLEATSIRRSATAGTVVDNAQSLNKEIASLQGSAGVSQKDLDFLKGKPLSQITAIQSVISLDVSGVTVLSVGTAPPSEVDVRLQADSNFDALEWRRQIAAAQGVARVVSFDPETGSALIYDVSLISGGN